MKFYKNVLKPVSYIRFICQIEVRIEHYNTIPW